MEPLFLRPVFQEKIWGGEQISHLFANQELPSGQRIGEAWVISAHPHGESIVENGLYEGLSLATVWKEHPELFGHPKGRFPLLVKILDAEDDLSVQVHPNDAYALAKHDDLGKSECWYIMSAQPDAEIIYGHQASSKEEFVKLVEEGQWENLFNKVSVKAGDFFYVPSGTIHAIGKGIMILEVQQSSDITYRLYDYDRVDKYGRAREIHIDDATNVSAIPTVDLKGISTHDEKKNETLIDEEYFTVEKWEIKEFEIFHSKSEREYWLATVVKGEGELVINSQKYPLTFGSSFILPVDIHEWMVTGNVTVIAAKANQEVGK